MSSAQYVSLPLWHHSFVTEGDKTIPPAVPYFMLFIVSFMLALSNALLSLMTWYHTGKPKTAKFSQFWHFYVMIGFFLALNGILLVYTSSPMRTSPIIQILLLNAGFVWLVPTTKLFSHLNDKAHFKFCSCTPVIAIVLAIYGILMGFLPSIIYSASHQTPSYFLGTGIIWFVLFFISMFPGAIANIFVERFFKKRYKNRDNSKNYTYDLTTISFSSYSAQFLIICMFFWVDMLPFFGTSSSLSTFTGGLRFAMQHFMDTTTNHSWIFGIIFYLSFFLQTVLSIFISPDSAKFVNIATTLSTPVAVLFLKISSFYSNTEEDKISPPWSLIPSLFLLLCGTITWKIWMNNEKKRVIKEAKYSTSLL